MRAVVSLSVYLESYSITREQFMVEVNKDREFYDKYIDWKKKDSDTIISPKALERLGEAFNGNKEEELKTDQIDIEDIMTAPTEEKIDMTEVQAETSEPLPVVPEEKKRRKRTPSVDKTPKRKKSKNSITKQFIAEHGRCSSGNTKDLRMLLMSSGLYKAEQVALMNDDEVQDIVSKDYYFIGAEEGTYIIKRSALVSIAGDVCFIGKEIQ